MQFIDKCRKVLATILVIMSQSEKKYSVEKKWGLLSSASYAVLMLVIGVPMWWKTTEVYRVSLPYFEIKDLTHILNLNLKVDIKLISTYDVQEGSHQLGQQLQNGLKGTRKK